jgi:hypothetical protein
VRRIIALTLVLAACAGSTRTLSGALETVPGDVDAAVSGLERALDRPIGVPEVFFTRISALGLSAAAGALYDQVTRLDATGVEEGMARYTGFVGDLLLAADDLDVALAVANPTGMALAWLRIEASAGSLAVGLSPKDCPLVAPVLTADLCRPESASDYDAGVEAVVRRFLGRYRPVMRLPAAFDDAVQGRIAVVVAPEVVASIDDALADLATLTPPESHAGVHQAFVDHFLTLRGIWSAADSGEHPTTAVSIPPVDATGTTIDWPSLEADLTDAACVASIAFVAGRVTLRAAEPASPIAALGALWLYGEGTGCP